jgi:hypothetical protein
VAVSSTSNQQWLFLLWLFSRGSKLVARGFFRLFANSQQLKANSWLFFPFLCLSSSYHLKNKTICDISNLFAY